MVYRKQQVPVNTNTFFLLVNRLLLMLTEMSSSQKLEKNSSSCESLILMIFPNIQSFQKEESNSIFCVSVVEGNTYTLPFMYTFRYVKPDEKVGPISRKNSSLFIA